MVKELTIIKTHYLLLFSGQSSQTTNPEEIKPVRHMLVEKTPVPAFGLPSFQPTSFEPHNAMQFCPVTRTSPRLPSTNTKPHIADFTVSNNYHQNICASHYNQMRQHLFWNTNLFYPQVRSINNSLLSYPAALGHIFDDKHLEPGYPKKQIKPYEVSSSSNCSDMNSDNDSIDVIEQEKNTSKKRNPYSIEELLKKPVKKIRALSFPQPRISNHNGTLNENIEENDIKNRFTIEVFD